MGAFAYLKIVVDPYLRFKIINSLSASQLARHEWHALARHAICMPEQVMTGPRALGAGQEPAKGWQEMIQQSWYC